MINLEQNKILKTALFAGEVMLKNGAEIFRVEDTMYRICAASALDYAETFVTPTGIFISVDDNTDHAITLIKRIKTRSTNLEKVALVNNLSRLYVKGIINFDTLNEQLDEINKKRSYNDLVYIFACAFGSAFSTLLFGGSIINFPFSFITGFFLGILLLFLNKTHIYPFIYNALGAAFVGAMAVLFVKIMPFHLSLDKIVIGCIMPLAPGVAITNAVRDYMYGDLVSGSARGADALITAVAIALGSGVVVKLFG